MIKCLIRHALRIAETVNGSYLLATIIVHWYFVLFQLFESGVEHLIFGERFQHELDWFFLAAYFAYLILVLYTCHFYNKFKKAFR